MERHCVAALITGLVTIWPVMRPVNSSLAWQQPAALSFCAAALLPLGVNLPWLDDAACLGMSLRNRVRCICVLSVPNRLKMLQLRLFLLHNFPLPWEHAAVA